MHDRYIWHQLPESVQQRCYFFNSFFWKKLTERSKTTDGGGPSDAAKANHERVKKWTKVKDL